MSDGRKAKVTPGKRRGNASRIARMYSADGRWSAESLIWMSPSCEPITPVLL